MQVFELFRFEINYSTGILQYSFNYQLFPQYPIKLEWFHVVRSNHFAIPHSGFIYYYVPYQISKAIQSFWDRYSAIEIYFFAIANKR